MKAKRTNGTKREKGSTANISSTDELVVQRLCSSVSGKAQKYNRVGPREFVTFEFEDVTNENIKTACKKHLRNIIEDYQDIDILSGEQGPSCYTMKHVNDLRLIYICFIARSVKSSEIKYEEESEPEPFVFPALNLGGKQMKKFKRSFKPSSSANSH